jgi:uncharacterized protein (TIGR00255 family)
MQSQPILSMTGHGHNESMSVDNLWRITAEITTVNRRNLDLAISSPREWNGLEATIQKWLQDRIFRGRVQVALRIEPAHFEQQGSLRFDAAQLAKDLAALRGLAQGEGIEFQPDAHFLWNWVQQRSGQASLPHWEDLLSAIQEAFEKALQQVLDMRAIEGAALAADLCLRLQTIATLTKEMVQQATGLVDRQRTLLRERLAKLGLNIDPDDERFLKEITLFADRSDISEEITRLQSHLQQGLSTLNEGGAVGRKLDFLCQEIHRELNTIGSKSASVELTRSVLDGKTTLEQLREQVQNLE